MWDAIWYLGFPMFAVSAFGSPYRKFENEGLYDSDKFDVVYDQRQNGTENYKLTVDGLSLVWSPNSLLAAAALLEPALYGEYPESSVDIVLGPDASKPEESLLGTQIIDVADNDNKTVNVKPDKMELSKPSKIDASSPPTVLVIESSTPPSQKLDPKLESSSTNSGSKRDGKVEGGAVDIFYSTKSNAIYVAFLVFVDI
ncbi:uncharacterized protein [Euwallacea similis]|uniref:uncharacterized protein n=1 Tax=Euwallacea similis TaxID=1736056 RepID=UPI0034507E92